MLIQPISVGKQEGKEYEILSEDIYQVELLDVNQAERPTYETRLMPKEQQKFDLVFNFDFVLLENELRGRRIWANFIPSYFYVSKKTGKNKLYLSVESLLDLDLTIDEYTQMEMNAASFLNSLVGKQCRVMIKHKEGKDRIFANPVEFLPVKALLESLSNQEKDNFVLKLQI